MKTISRGNNSFGFVFGGRGDVLRILGGLLTVSDEFSHSAKPEPEHKYMVFGELKERLSLGKTLLYAL